MGVLCPTREVLLPVIVVYLVGVHPHQQEEYPPVCVGTCSSLVPQFWASLGNFLLQVVNEVILVPCYSLVVQRMVIILLSSPNLEE